MISDILPSFNTFPPVKLPDFNNIVSFVSQIFSSQLIMFSFSDTSLHFLLREACSSFVTCAKMEITTHGFEYCVAMSTKFIHIKTVNLFLIPGCITVFNSAFWELWLKIRHEHVLKCSQFIGARTCSEMLSIYWCELWILRICVELPSCVKTSWHFLTQWKWIELTSINTHDRFTYDFWIPDVGLVNNCLSCEHNRRTISHVLACFIM